MKQFTVQTPYMVGEVHFYTAELDSGLALFDTGPPLPAAEASLLANVDMSRLKYLFITHCHVDHYGLTNFVLENSSAEVFIGRTDAIKFVRHEERLASMASLLGQYGFGEDFLQKLRDSFTRYNIFPKIPERYRIVEDSPEIAKQGVNWLSCPGHSQSDIVYLCGDYAVSGDILLRSIFQAPLLDINLETFEGRFRNYDAYCATILKLAQLRDYRIMPGHRHYVESLDDSILFYVTTLLERAVQLLPLRQLSLTEIIDRIFQGRLSDPFIVYLKVSEVVFMLDFIENPLLLKTSLEQIGLFDKVSELYMAVSKC